MPEKIRGLQKEVRELQKDLSPTESGIESINEIDQEIQGYLKYLVKETKDTIKAKILLDNALGKLTLEERSLIELRYFKKYKWEVVARGVLLCRTTCHMKHKDIIKKLERHIKKHEKNDIEQN